MNLGARFGVLLDEGRRQELCAVRAGGGNDAIPLILDSGTAIGWGRTTAGIAAPAEEPLKDVAKRHDGNLWLDLRWPQSCAPLVPRQALSPHADPALLRG